MITSEPEYWEDCTETEKLILRLHNKTLPSRRWASYKAGKKADSTGNGHVPCYPECRENNGWCGVCGEEQY